ncbi:MAG: FAD-linked oxidase C-terminal domain-containing protein [Phototrophicaceae bacterium]
MVATAIHDIVQDLNRAIGDENVQFDQTTRALYSTDASNYQIMPIGVTYPRTADDVVAIHQITAQYHTPILPRGGGSSLAGQTVGEAVVMDFSRYLRRVRSINAQEKSVIVESGLVLEQLNRQLQSLGLMFGPDPASANRATIGGCIGNNATGSHSILYGLTSDNIKRLQVVLADGQKMWLDDHNSTLTALRETVAALAIQHADQIQARYPQTFRSVAGYALNKIDPKQVDLAALFAGSEGTLGTIVAAELKLVDYMPAPRRRLAMVHFDSLRASLEATPRILELNPSAIELMDKMLMDKTRASSEFSRYMDFIDGDPKAVLVTEFYGESDKELTNKIAALKSLLRSIGHHGSVTIASSAKQQGNVWTIRKAGLGLLMSERSDAKPIAFVEDAAVPVEQLANYIDDVQAVVEREGTTFAIYAHASAGCLHVRPLINLKTVKGRSQYRNIAEALTDAAIKYKGTITGEHGQGIVRGEFTEKLFGADLTNAFRQIKHAFDPDKRMNPGKIVDTPAMDDPNLLRYTPEYEVIELKTRFDWSQDGGISGAAEMCNGAGVCRKEGSGTMCPSYMATHDERHATRGRANALRLAMSGKLPDGMSNDALDDIFSLCLSCKACSSECPSSVDVAKMKSEFLAARHDEKGIPLTTRLFGNIHRINKLGSLMPHIANFMLDNPIGLAAAKLIGLPIERPLPKFAHKRFTRFMPKQKRNPKAATLIVDTFTEYNHPEIGTALLNIAKKAGLSLNIMRLPQQGCCGRPAISKGLLDQAQQMAIANVQYISNHIPDGDLIFLEPSCQSAFVDDYQTLVSPPYQAAAQAIKQRAISAEAWLMKALTTKSLEWVDDDLFIMVHGHCHQKALWSTRDTLALLDLIPYAEIEEIDSGCCGVAGSFGYEHYDVSMKIGNDRLLPAIAANPDAIIAAGGTSCRAQITDAGYPVQHPIEIISQTLIGQIK